jgi:peptidoglycan/LPS O-acetylase OafA/YrhL
VVLDRVEHLGNFGVKVFFEISGFLITTLLLRELSSRGGISLVGFYRRRILRIFPAYWAYLACLMVLSQAKLIELWPGDMLSAMTYTANYHHWRSWYVNHLWSLSVEEQFYLIWPLLLCVIGLRRALYVAAAVVIAAPAVRTFMWFGLHAGGSWMTRQFEATADALAIGCVLAGCFNVLGNNRRYIAILQSPWFVLVPFVGLPLSIVGGLTWFYVVGQSLAHLTIVLCIDRCVRFPWGALGWPVEFQTFRVLGGAELLALPVADVVHQ